MGSIYANFEDLKAFDPALKMKNRKTNYGFTLIELILVISIIGFLSSVVLFSVTSLREKAKDTRRIRDLKALTNGLEIFYGKYTVYPCGAYQLPGGVQVDVDYDHTGVGSNTFLAAYQTIPFPCTGGTNDGMATPGIRDPGGSFFAYEVTSNRQNYILYTQLRDPSNAIKMQQDGGLVACFYEIGPGLGQMMPSLACPP